MGPERRGRADQGQPRANPQGEEPGAGPGPKVKSFEIDKRLMVQAWEKVRANNGAPGVDAVSTSLFAEHWQKDGSRNRYQIQARLPAPGPGTRDPAIEQILALFAAQGRLLTGAARASDAAPAASRELPDPAGQQPSASSPPRSGQTPPISPPARPGTRQHQEPGCLAVPALRPAGLDVPRDQELTPARRTLRCAWRLRIAS